MTASKICLQQVIWCIIQLVQFISMVLLVFFSVRIPSMTLERNHIVGILCRLAVDDDRRCIVVFNRFEKHSSEANSLQSIPSHRAHSECVEHRMRDSAKTGSRDWTLEKEQNERETRHDRQDEIQMHYYVTSNDQLMQSRCGFWLNERVFFKWTHLTCRLRCTRFLPISSTMNVQMSMLKSHKASGLASSEMRNNENSIAGEKKTVVCVAKNGRCCRARNHLFLATKMTNALAAIPNCMKVFCSRPYFSQTRVKSRLKTTLQRSRMLTSAIFGDRF